MPTQGEKNLKTSGVPNKSRGRRLRGALLLGMGCLAILSAFFAGTMAQFLVAVVLMLCGALEILETFQADDEAGRRSTYLSGALSVFAGIRRCRAGAGRRYLLGALPAELRGGLGGKLQRPGALYRAWGTRCSALARAGDVWRAGVEGKNR